MPLFKVWSEDKLNKKFVVAENFAQLVFKGKRFMFIFVYFTSAGRDRTLHATSDLAINIHIFKASLSFGDRLCLHILFVGCFFFFFFISKCMP